MAIITQQWTLSTWANRASATYVPISQAINNVTIDYYGRKTTANHFGNTEPRRAYKTQTTTNSSNNQVVYIMHDTDTEGAVPIIRITKS